MATGIGRVPIAGAGEPGLLEREEGETTMAQGEQWTDKASGHIIAIIRAMPCHGASHGTGGFHSEGLG